MAEITKISRCEQLQQEINSINEQISTNNTKIKQLKEDIKNTSSIANALALSDRPALQKELEKLQNETNALTTQNTSLQNQLNALYAAFQQSGLQCVNETFECSGPNNEILSIPLFIAQGPSVTFDTSGLEAEKTKLENERDQKLQPINGCLDKDTGIKVFIDRLLDGNNDLVHPVIGSRSLREYVEGNNDLNPKLSPLSYPNRANFYNYIVSSLGNCLDLTDGNDVAPKRILSFKTQLEKLLQDKGSWKSTKNTGTLKENASRDLQMLVKLNIIRELNDEKNKILSKYDFVINKIQNEINQLSNSNSNFNKQSSNTIIDIIKEFKNNAPEPNLISTTTISAPGGIGLPQPNPCSQTVTKTVSNSKAVFFDPNSYSINLNKQRAVKELGPGGCEIENPIWIEPVSIITNNISVNNIQDIKNFLIQRLQENTKYQEMEKRTSTSIEGVATPINQFDIFTNFSLNDKVLRACVGTPK
jgi:hypothetical protein